MTMALACIAFAATYCAGYLHAARRFDPDVPAGSVLVLVQTVFWVIGGVAVYHLAWP